MKDPKPINDVAEFHRLFKLPIEKKPIIPSKERCALRIALLREELEELEEAIKNDDLLEVMDAFCDLQYVLSGAILEFGAGEKFKAMFEEVHRSNMSKACKTMEEAESTRQKYLTERNTDSIIEEVENEYLVYRKNDRKVLKSINYSPADLQKFIDEK